MIDESDDWPPPHITRKSKRARHLQIKITPEKGLELIVPLRVSMRTAKAFLNKHRAWIEDALEEVKKHQREEEPAELPELVVLHSIEQSWRIEYVAMNQKPEIILRPHQEMAVVGDINHQEKIKVLLSDWIKSQAKIHLTEKMKELCFATGMEYKRLSFRGQKGRWGSCACDKSISLNYKLILLPPNLCRYILLHELCHTVELNHSTRFWDLVAEFDPDWNDHRKQLEDTKQYIPLWVR